jgi:hypothetical protein
MQKLFVADKLYIALHAGLENINVHVNRMFETKHTGMRP